MTPCGCGTSPIPPTHPLGQPLTGHTDAVKSVAFSPDGHTLASGSADRHRTVVESHRPRQPQTRWVNPCTGHTDAVLSVAFSPDGHTLASGSNDQASGCGISPTRRTPNRWANP